MDASRAIVAPRRSPPTRCGCGARGTSPGCRRSPAPRAAPARRDRRRPHPRPRRADRHGGGRGARGDRLVQFTDYEARRRARHPGGEADVFLLHVEATDEAGHAGNLDEKVKALEAWDTRILDGLVEGLDALGPGACCCSRPPDAGGAAHHTTDPVPYLLVDSADDGPGGTYSEAATAGHPGPGPRDARAAAGADWPGRHRPPAVAGLHRRCRPCFEPLGARATVAPFCRGATVSSGRVTGQPPTPSQCEVVPPEQAACDTPRCLPPAYRQRSTDPVSPEAVR